MGWEWELTDLDGVTVGLIRPRSVTVTRNLNAASTVEVDADGVPALTTAALVRGWRPPDGGGDRVLRACGKIRTALQLAAARDTLEGLNIQAVDGMGVLADRLVNTTRTFTATTPRDIVHTLLVDQHLRAWIGLDITDDAAGPPRDRTYEVGKNVAEAVQQLAEVDDGFYYRVDPVDLEVEPLTGNPFFYRLVLLHPTPGNDSAASFEFGPGTAGNLAGVQVDIRPPVNSALAFGAGDGEAQLVAAAKDEDSIDRYGLMETSRSFPDVVEQATLDQHAREMLRPEERVTFRVRPALTAPRPWDDFDVGDSVRLNIRTEARTFVGRALVKSFTVTVDENGTERLSSLDFQQED